MRLLLSSGELLDQSLEEVRGECLAACLTSHHLAVLKGDKGWCGYNSAVLGEVRPLTTALGVSDGDDVFPAINLGELTLHALAGETAFLNEKMDLWSVHGSSEISVGCLNGLMPRLMQCR